MQREVKRAKLDIVDLSTEGEDAQHASPAITLPLLPYYLSTVRGLGKRDNEQCIGLGDIISGDFDKAILTNFMFEPEWLLSTVFGDSNTGRDLMQHKHVSTFRPKMMSWFGTHHSKIILCFFSAGVRVSIVTGNFIQIDWINKTEATWIQDFPKLEDDWPDDRSEFGEDLRDYIAQLNNTPADPEFSSSLEEIRGHGHEKLAEALRELRRFDFSAAQAVLIPSVPGKFQKDAADKYGYAKVRRYLAKEEIPACFMPASLGKGSRCLGIVSQFSSFGSHAKDGAWVKQEFEKALLTSCAGVMDSSQIRRDLIWPRMEDVEASIEGWNAGGALPARPKNLYHDEKRQILHPYVRARLCRFVAHRWGRNRAMPHHKSFTRYAVDEKGLVHLAWVMIGSHNFSKPAWGNPTKKHMAIDSFEMGVLLLPSRYRTLHRTFSLDPDHPVLGLHNPGHDDIRGFFSASCQQAKEMKDSMLAIPIPYELPPPRYQDCDKPWVSPPRMAS